MFGKKKDEITPLKVEIDSLHSATVSINNELAVARANLDTMKATVKAVTIEMGDLKEANVDFQDKYYKDLERLKIDMERRLVEFHKEISDKYFQGLENIFKYTREIQLIDNLSKNTNGQDFKALRSALMQPLLDYRYKMEREQTGAQIDKFVDAKSTDLVTQRDKIHNEFIIVQREGRDTKFLEGKLEILNQIIKGAKNEKIS